MSFYSKASTQFGARHRLQEGFIKRFQHAGHRPGGWFPEGSHLAQQFQPHIPDVPGTEISDLFPLPQGPVTTGKPFFRLGRCVDRRRVEVDVERSFAHMAWIGPSGVGKSSGMIRAIIDIVLALFALILFYDPKCTARYKFIEMGLPIDRLLVIPSSCYRECLTQPVLGATQEEAWNDLADSIGSGYFLHSAQRGIREAMPKLHRCCGRDEGASLSMLIDFIEQEPAGRSYREQTLKDSRVSALKDLRNNTGDMFECVYSNLWDQLLKHAVGKVVIFEGQAPSANAHAFVANRGIDRVFRFKRNHPKQSNDVILVHEDASTTHSAERSKMTPGGMTKADMIATLGREFRVGQIIATHQPGTTSPHLLSNAETIIVPSGRRMKPSELQTLLSCTYQQAVAAQHLPMGWSVASVPSLSTQPMLLYQSEPRQSTPEQRDRIDAEMEKNTNAFLRICTITDGPKGKLPIRVASRPVSSDPSKQAQERLTPPMRQVLANLTPIITPTQAELTQRLRISRTKAAKVFASLENEGLIEMIPLPAGRGGAIKAVLPTAKGRAAIEELGFECEKPITTGASALHNFGQKIRGELGRAEGSQVTYEAVVDTGNNRHVRVDVRLIDPTGSVTFVQVAVSRPGREIEAIAQLLPVIQGSNNRIELIAHDPKLLDQIKRGLKERFPRCHLAVQFFKLGELVKRYYETTTK